MAPGKPQPEYIPLQVGSEVRITQRGDIKITNPTLEADAADAVITYYLDPGTSEHVIRLVDPLAPRSRS